jgi:hypothetical protein
MTVFQSVKLPFARVYFAALIFDGFGALFKGRRLRIAYFQGTSNTVFTQHARCPLWEYSRSSCHPPQRNSQHDPLDLDHYLERCKMALQTLILLYRHPAVSAAGCIVHLGCSYLSVKLAAAYKGRELPFTLVHDPLPRTYFV